MLFSLASQAEQLRRTLWLVVQHCGGQVVVDETDVHPLYRIQIKTVDIPINPTALKAASGKRTQLVASLLPTPTEDQLKKLAVMLLGTSQRIEDVIGVTDLKEYPEKYIMAKLMAYAVYYDDRWMPPDDAAAFSTKKAGL